MIRYLETFFRHRLLLTAPILLAVAVAVGYAAIQPRTYESTGSLWFDAAPVASVGTQPTADASPAKSEMAVLKELLNTRDFSVKVGRRGPLATYLSTHAASPGITTTIRAGLERLGLLSPHGAVGGQALDDLIAAELPQDVTATAVGPHVLTIAVDAPTGAVARGTAQALMAQLSDELIATQRTRSQTAVDYYNVRVQDAQAAVEDADAKLASYISAHLKTSGGAVADPTEAELRRTDDLARQRYDDLQSQLDQAKLDLSHVADDSGFRVVDAPEAPGGPLSYTKHIVYAVIGGLIVGLLISGTVLVLITTADVSARRREDVARALGVDPVTTIARFTHSWPSGRTA